MRSVVSIVREGVTFVNLSLRAALMSPTSQHAEPFAPAP